MQPTWTWSSARTCRIAPGPQMFTQDDDGLSVVLPGREDGHGSPLAREAARACPVSAITVAES
ncbi:ferredoxin [Streptomyces nojiriensis]|uniref:ferredoxin n=1 Tax=Streptomyces nojiriensis TaxID=66374 RepID=UPI003657E3E4